MLCSVCQNIEFHTTDYFGDGHPPPRSTFKTTKNGPFFYPHHPSLNALKYSAQQNCNFCVQILFSFMHLDIDRLRLQPDSRLWLHYRLLGANPLPSRISISCGSCHSDVYVLALDKTPFQHPDPTANPHTGSQQNLLLAKTWLDECVNQHPECQSQQSGYRPMPTRVLEVSLERVRLLETHEMCGEYAILSHCWGPKPIITTKLQDIAIRCQNIDFSALSKTFQDAVIVTRSLGLRYLWIDSLCIIQDSKKDWEIESSKMGTYYAYAQICIAATAASEGSIGCFFERHPAKSQPTPLSIRLNGADHLTHILTRVERLWVKNFLSALVGQLQGASGPLETRGWVLQETIISKRMLRFRGFQIEWACRTKYASEGDRLGKPAPTTAEWDCFRALTILDSQISRFGPLSRHNIWYDIVEEYTQRELSYGTDTLPALSGIATQYQEMTTDLYLAGLWKSDLSRGLLWRTPMWTMKSPYQNPERIREASRPASYRAPSWSWASIDAPSINWDLISDWSSIDAQTVTAELVDEAKEGESCYQLLDIRISHAGFNKFGEISSGKLIVHGVIMSAEVWALEEGTERNHFDDNIRHKVGAESVLIGRFDPDETRYEPPSIFLLPIIRPKQPTQEAEQGEGDERVLCLALEPINGQTGIYTRIGTASILNWEIFDGIESTELTVL